MAQSSVESDRLSSAGISTHSSGTAGTVGGSVVGVRVGDPNHKREDEDDYNLGPLPPMWEKAFTPSGERYFIDYNTGTSHWLDPRLARVRKHSLGECGEDELPYGWERVTDERYGSYYVDHINRRTQYENPVLQARRLRAEKMAAENGNNNQVNGPPPTGELRGERFTLNLTKGPQGLGFTLIGAEGIPETEGYLQIRSIVPHSPAWIDGALRPGDVVVGVGQRAVRGLSHAQVAQIFQSITPGTEVTLHLVRGYPLSFDSEDPNTRVLSTLAVDATTPATPDAVAMQQLTRALRTRFNLDSPNHVDTSQGRDETDNSPDTPHSPNQRRLMSRSFDLDEIGTTNENKVPPRCPSADHLLSLASDHPHRNNNGIASEPGREFVLTLRRGAAGFGFTIADSVHGQKVKKVLDRSRCAGLREGDLLLQIGETDVRHAPHQHVVQVLKECPALSESTLRVWRRSARAPRSRSATRAAPPNTNNNIQLGRSKTPTAEQLRSAPIRTPDNELLERQNGMNSGFPEDGMLHSPSTAAVGGLSRQSPSTSRNRPHSPSNSNGRMRSHSPSNNSASERLLANSPSTRLQSQSPSNNSSNSRIKGSPLSCPMTCKPITIVIYAKLRSPTRSPCYAEETQNALYVANYPQVEAGGATDPEADVLVRLARGSAGFGFRIVGGTEDGSRVAVGYVVPGGPADGLLRPGDLLTSVDGIPLAGATHALAVAYVCDAAARGHVTLGVRHNRADIQPLGLPTMPTPHAHQPLLATEPLHHVSPASYNILHPAPMYPPAAHMSMYGVQYDTNTGWSPTPYDVTVTRNEGEGFGFVVISSTNKATSTIGQLIANSPAARCGRLHVGDTIVAINGQPVRSLPHPDVVALIKRSGAAVTLTVTPPDPRHD